MAGSIQTESSVNIRSRIGGLYSLCYSETLLKLLCGYEMPMSLRERIMSLRSAWFSRTEAENLALLEEVSAESVTLIMEMVHQFEAYTRRRHAITQGSHLSNQRYTVLFSETWNADLFRKKYAQGHLSLSVVHRKFEHDFLSVPRVLSIYPAWYSSASGTFGQMLRSAYKGKSSADVPRGAEVHMHALSLAFEDYSKTGGMHKIPYNYGFRPMGAYWRNLLGWGIVLLWRLRA